MRLPTEMKIHAGGRCFSDIVQVHIPRCLQGQTPCDSLHGKAQI
ncbi:hypothetical protein GGI1_01778, partial [Acidithiobacillus sp. GGI-221]